eukprot:349785-Chlamydomonas_euryale.AAC.4
MRKTLLQAADAAAHAVQLFEQASVLHAARVDTVSAFPWFWLPLVGRAAYAYALSMSQSQSYRERTHEGYAYVERSVADGIKQRAGHCHKGHATAYGPEPLHTNPTPPAGT